MTDSFKSSRYPYTYACDYLRMLIGRGISRSEASVIRQRIAKALSMDDEALARQLADAYLARTEEEQHDDAMRVVLAVLRRQGHD